ncbi:MAG: hypothetical protein AB8G14_12305 [Ilumatobacter sp.]
MTSTIAVAALSAAAPNIASAAECAGGTTAADLDSFFQADDAAGLAGADYPHAIDLPDGRTLWYFQDAFIGSGAKLTSATFAHNAALVQDGECFRLLPPPGGDGDSWIGSWVETDLQNWLWPLDAEVGADGNLWLFLSEVQNPNGDGAARGALPVGTWIARYSLPDLQLLDMQPAPDPSRSLFGYSIVSDSEYSYLYGHCYRQFDEAGLIGFDPTCSPHAYVARVPVGAFDQELEYWTSTGWSDNRGDRLPILSSELSMPVSVQRFGDVYVAVSDEGDWFGDDVVIYTSAAPQGPWTEASRFTPETTCGPGCNNYGAFLMPQLEGDQIVIAHSNNARDMRYSFELASLYRIGVRAVDIPGVAAANLQRAPDLELARAEPEQRTPATPPSSTLPAQERVLAVTATEAAPTWFAGQLRAPATPAWLSIAQLVVMIALVAAVTGALPIAGLTVSRSQRRAHDRRTMVLDRRTRGAEARRHHRPATVSPALRSDLVGAHSRSIE